MEINELPVLGVDHPMHLAIRDLLGDIRRIVTPVGETPTESIIGFDFIAVGDGRNFVDYLIHDEVRSFLNHLDGYFESNPSLLLVPGLDDCLYVFENGQVNSVLCDRTYGPLFIEKSQFLARHIDPKDGQKYWHAWCERVREFYTECKAIYFHQIEFENIQNTGVFVYFNRDVGSILESNNSREYLKKACSLFLYQQGADVILPRHIKRIASLGKRTAISQVMARNMSHNINSHVSYKATNPNIKRRILDLYGF